MGIAKPARPTTQPEETFPLAKGLKKARMGNSHGFALAVMVYFVAAVS